VIDATEAVRKDDPMPEQAKGRYEFTYLTDHGSPAELIDRTLGTVENWTDRHIASVAEAAGDSQIHSVLGRLTFREKLVLLLPEGVDGLDEHYGGRDMWQEVHDLIELHPALDELAVEATLHAWLEKRGWYEQDHKIPQAPEPLHSEILLRIALDGLLLYLSGWFENTRSG